MSGVPNLSFGAYEIAGPQALEIFYYSSNTQLPLVNKTFNNFFKNAFRDYFLKLEIAKIFFDTKIISRDQKPEAQFQAVLKFFWELSPTEASFSTKIDLGTKTLENISLAALKFFSYKQFFAYKQTGHVRPAFNVDATGNVLIYNPAAISSPHCNITSFKKVVNSSIKDILKIKGSYENLTTIQKIELANKIWSMRETLSLPSIKAMDMSYMDISYLGFLEKNTSLKELYLYRNSIESIEVLSRLVNLEILDLSRNQIQDASPLCSLKRLKKIDISNNKLQIVSPGFALLPYLEYLNISLNLLMTVPPEFFYFKNVNVEGIENCIFIPKCLEKKFSEIEKTLVFNLDEDIDLLSLSLSFPGRGIPSRLLILKDNKTEIIEAMKQLKSLRDTANNTSNSLELWESVQKIQDFPDNLLYREQIAAVLYDLFSGVYPRRSRYRQPSFEVDLQKLLKEHDDPYIKLGGTAFERFLVDPLHPCCKQLVENIIKYHQE